MNFPKKLSELNPQLIKDAFDNKWSSVSDFQTTDTKVAAFETVNGKSIAIFYNPNCKNDMETGINSNVERPEWGDWFYIQNRMCANFVYDLNGLKGPNKMGRDIGFITALYAKKSEVVSPIPFETDVDNTKHTQQEAIELCANYADDSRLPNKHELSSMFYNKNLVGNFQQDAVYWSGSVISVNKAWKQVFTYGSRERAERSQIILFAALESNNKRGIKPLYKIKDPY